MAESKMFRPRAYPIRGPLETKKEHGAVVNPPRMAKLGGLDSPTKSNGHFKNSMTLKKPGGTR